MKIEKVDKMPDYTNRSKIYPELHDHLDKMKSGNVIRVECDKTKVALYRSTIHNYKKKTGLSFKTRHVEGYLYIKKQGERK